MHRWLIVCVAGCGRIAFDPIEPPTGDGPAEDAAANDMLIAHWQFEDVPSDGALDSTGNGHSGTCLTSCPSIDVAGKRGAGYRFDGVDDMLEVADAPDLHINGPMTAALWLNRTVGGGEVSVVTKRFGTSFRNSFQLTVLPGGELHVCSTEATDLGRCDDSAPGTISNNAFTHVAYVFDGTTHIGYVDGVEVVRMATGINFDTGKVYIGGDIDDAMPTFFFPGVLDDVRIYARALGVAELAVLAAP